MLEPGFQLGEDFVEEFVFASEQMGVGQQDQMLMAIEFPDEFVIADGGEAQIVKAAEVLGLGGFVMGVIATPFDFGPVSRVRPRRGKR